MTDDRCFFIDLKNNRVSKPAGERRHWIDKGWTLTDSNWNPIEPEPVEPEPVDPAPGDGASQVDTHTDPPPSGETDTPPSDG